LFWFGSFLFVFYISSYFNIDMILFWIRINLFLYWKTAVVYESLLASYGKNN
jgi:hypothetical protein